MSACKPLTRGGSAARIGKIGEELEKNWRRCGRENRYIDARNDLIWRRGRGIRTRARFGIRENILLRVIDIIEEAGTALAFPSQTLYLGRDRGSDSIKAKNAEASVEE